MYEHHMTLGNNTAIDLTLDLGFLFRAWSSELQVVTVKAGDALEVDVEGYPPKAIRGIQAACVAQGGDPLGLKFAFGPYVPPEE